MQPPKQFYLTGKGKGLMDNKNYNAAIKDFLTYESLLVCKLLKKNNYQTLIELGCSQALNALLYLSCCDNYCGVDINPEFLEKAKNNYNKNKNKINLINSEIEDFLLNHKTKNDSLYLLPFNLFGNIRKNISILNFLLEKGRDVLISSFNTDCNSFRARFDYYSRCGLNNLQFISRPGYTFFFSKDGLASYSYSPGFFLEHLKASIQENKTMACQIIKENSLIGWHLYIKETPSLS